MSDTRDQTIPGDEMYDVHEIDPTTIHSDVNAPIRENLEGLIHMAKVKVRRDDCYVMIYHDETRGYAIKSIDREMFEKGQVQCPRQADLNYEAEFKKPRVFPSILVKPDGSVIVSKPSLCNGCTNLLQRTVFGCHSGQQFTSLSV